MNNELMLAVENNDLEGLARAIEAHEDFQVLRRFKPKDMYEVGEPLGHLLKGIILDTETTGRDPEKDAIVELGMVAFEFCPVTGRVYRIIDVYDELEDPGFPIPPEAAAVNHIADEMVAGKRIDDDRVFDMVADAVLIVAHNSSFDRPFCEKRFPVFAGKAWACSLNQVDWEGEGLPKKLEYLAMTLGMFYEAHRAEMDCRVLLEVLSRVLPKSGQRAMKALYDKHSHCEVVAYAMDTKFETKDALKARGYSWNGGDNGKPKAWFVRLTEETYQAEVEWLAANIYNYRKFVVNCEEVDAFTRFSRRSVGILPRMVQIDKPVPAAVAPVADVDAPAGPASLPVPSAPVSDREARRLKLSEEAHAKCEERLPDDVVEAHPSVLPEAGMLKAVLPGEPDTVGMDVSRDEKSFALTPAGVGVAEEKSKSVPSGPFGN